MTGTEWCLGSASVPVEQKRFRDLLLGHCATCGRWVTLVHGRVRHHRPEASVRA